MPFTLAHPALIIPLYRALKKYTSLTGLIIGSIVPDVEYCINIVTRSVISHTFRGIFVFDFPMGIFFAICFHAFLKQVFVFQLPLFIQKKFIPYTHAPWFEKVLKNPLPFLSSLFIGIILHLLWDSISHESGYFVKRVAFLNHTVLHHSIAVNRLIWHVSTWTGIYFVIRFFQSFPEESKSIASPANKNFWPLVFLIACVTMFMHWLPFLRPQEPRFLFVSFSGSMLLGVLLISFIFRLSILYRK
jgi:hypothetical protein